MRTNPASVITSLHGPTAGPLDLTTYTNQDPRVIRRACDRGVNWFFFYGPGNREFIEGLRPLARRRREKIIIATGSGACKRTTSVAERRKIITALGSKMIDVFFAEYVMPDEKTVDGVFRDDGVLDELQQ